LRAVLTSQKLLEIARIAAIALFGCGLALPARSADLSLAQAEALLAARNRELQLARRAAESADAQLVIAGARPNPTLSLNSSQINNNPGIGNGPLAQKRIDTVLRLDQPIERGSKRELRIGAAQGLASAARGDALDTLRQQLAALRTSYYELKFAQEKLVVLGETAQLFERSFAAAQTRLKAGDLAAADLAKLQVDYERSRNDARAAVGDLARAQLALAYLIGEEARASELRAADDWPAPRALDAASMQRAIDARPDVLAARARLEAAQQARDLALAQRTRDVVVGAQIERMPGTDPVNSIGVGIAIPLFTGYDFSGDIRKAETDRYAARDALDRTRALAAVDLRRAASDAAAAAERVARFQGELLGAAERAAQGAEFAFERGGTTVLEVLDARRTLRAVRLEALAARADYAKALAAWQASFASAESLEAIMPKKNEGE
jgi:cobalt-zinc-cadmium efflux system outer membrane protein